MPSIRALLFLGLPLASVSSTYAADFQDLVKEVPVESLKVALEQHPRYRQGVFEDHQDAIQAVHQDDPALATRLVDIAKQDLVEKLDLKRRQNTNTTAVPVTTAIVVTDPTTTVVSLTTSTSVQSPQGQLPSATSVVDGVSSVVASVVSSITQIVGTSIVILPTTVLESTVAVTTDAPATTVPSITAPATTAPGTTAPGTTAPSTTVRDSTSVQANSAAGSEASTAETSTGNAGGTTAAITPTDAAGNPSTTTAVADSTVAASSRPAVTTTDNAGSAVVSPSTASVPATQTGVIVPIVGSSTDSGGSVVVVASSAFVTSASESLDVAITTTNAQGSTFTTSTIVPAAIITSTDDQGSAVVTTSPLANVQIGAGGSIITAAPAFGASPSPIVIATTDEFGNSITWSGASAGAVLTTTDARGRTVVTTITPDGGQVSQLVLRTSTLPDGSRSTITSYVIPGGDVATTTRPGEPAETSPAGSPGLQSGMAAPTRRLAGEVAALIGGAIGIAAFL